jgi:hypothetical protein
MKKTKKSSWFVYVAVLVSLLVSTIAPATALAGGWHTNIEITDIYPGGQPYGQFWFRITNHGPGNMVNVQVRVNCVADRLDKNNGVWSLGDSKTVTVKATLQPGQTQAFPSGVSLDSNTFSYNVACTVQSAPWEDGGPNNYVEFVP